MGEEMTERTYEGCVKTARDIARENNAAFLDGLREEFPIKEEKRRSNNLYCGGGKKRDPVVYSYVRGVEVRAAIRHSTGGI